MQVVRAVAHHRQAVRLGETGHLHEGRDAAAGGEVGLREIDPAGADQGRELGERVVVFARRQRHLAHRAQMRVAGRVVRRNRLLKPDQVEGLQLGHGAHRLLHPPGLVRVRHQLDLVRQVVAHRLDPRDILPERRAPQPHLDRPEARLDAHHAARQQLVHREVEVDIARIGAHARVRPAEQPPERAAQPVALQVPERDIHRRHREAGGSAPPGIVVALVEVPPDRLDQVRVLALDAGAEGAVAHGRDRAALPFMHHGVAHPR